MASRRSYLIRAIYDWAIDHGFTPHLLVAADQPGVEVPMAFVKDGRIALNISPMAVRDFDPMSDPIFFSARFGGRPFELTVPSGAVIAVYASENGEGLVIGEPEVTPPDEPGGGPSETNSRPRGRPQLKVVK